MTESSLETLCLERFGLIVGLPHRVNLWQIGGVAFGEV